MAWCDPVTHWNRTTQAHSYQKWLFDVLKSTIAYHFFVLNYLHSYWFVNTIMTWHSNWLTDYTLQLDQVTRNAMPVWLKLRQYGCLCSHVVQYFQLTLPSLFPSRPVPLQKRNGLQMNQKMPTPGTFRSSPWALTWPTKSTNTNPLVVWFHQSEKLKMNAEHRVFLLTHQTSVRSFKGNGQRSPMEE